MCHILWHNKHKNLLYTKGKTKYNFNSHKFLHIYQFDTTNIELHN